ncbi:MAG TPA: SIMPL domain-containing protein [Candidatus Acidoferrum sp.]|nr:SIMPL domain-containing protein [Candidatus Acidoferrum sp.]
MKRLFLALVAACSLAVISRAQNNNDIKFIAETLVVQADGAYQADPDLATLTFDISTQDKELRVTYDSASQSMQKIIALAEKYGVAKNDVVNGVLTVRPFYEGDRKKKAKSYLVQGQITLKIRDFSKIGPILEASVEDGITDFRSLTYSLADEEAAKQKAVAEAMKRALGRASAALEQKGQKVGALRFANLDVKQLTGVSSMDVHALRSYSTSFAMTETATVSGSGGWGAKKTRADVPPPPIPQPEKITVGATVQCAFQIQ